MYKAFSSLLLVIIFSSISINANALIIVKGGGDCGEWLADKEIWNKAWMLGYVSGFAYGTTTDILKNTSSDSVFLWMDNYCKANPLEHMSEAGRALFYELKKKNGL